MAMTYQVEDHEPEFVLAWQGNDAEPADGIRYAAIIASVFERIRGDATEDPTTADALALLHARQKLRADLTSKLREDAQLFVSGGVSADTAAFRAPQYFGSYRANFDWLNSELFEVSLEKDAQQFASDLKISVRGDLPSPHDKPSPGQHALYGALTAARTTIRAIYQPLVERYARDDGDAGATVYAAGIRGWWQRFWEWANTTNRWEDYRKMSKARARLDHYVRELASIATLGLRDGFLDLASLALKGLKDDLVAIEGPRIKNAYVKRLGIWAVFFAIVWIILTLVARAAPTQETIIFVPFTIASLGAAAGTWLSFSIRRVTLTFEQLSSIEEDMLEPALRLLFVWGLTIVVVLIFFTGAMNVNIGDLKTTVFAKTDAALGPFRAEAIYLLVGLFCGIAERGLASAVSQRATDFVSTVGGAKTP
jgi:hypothetical protein